MNSKIQSVPIAPKEQQRARIAQLQEGPSRSRGGLARAALGAFALLFAGACSSKSEDALPGVNVDENLAMMDANASSNAGMMIKNASETNDGSAGVSNSASDRSDIKPGARAPRTALSRSAKIGKIGTDTLENKDETEENQAATAIADPNGA